jgi:hypothetical protein
VAVVVIGPPRIDVPDNVSSSRQRPRDDSAGQPPLRWIDLWDNELLSDPR